MILTLVFIAATFFCANKAIKAHKETGKQDWWWVFCTATALVLSVLAATRG